MDNYNYVGANTLTGRRAKFWFNAFNQDTCYDTQTLTLVDRSALSGTHLEHERPKAVLARSASQYVNANIQNTPAEASITRSPSRGSAQPIR